jgi:hypothetical protein
VEADNPGAAGLIEMAADSIADALFEFGEGFGLGEDGLTESLSLVAPFGRFFNQKDDFIHRLSYYISWGRGRRGPRPLMTHLPKISLMSHSLIVLSPEPEARSCPSGLNATELTQSVRSFASKLFHCCAPGVITKTVTYLVAYQLEPCNGLPYSKIVSNEKTLARFTAGRT